MVSSNSSRNVNIDHVNVSAVVPRTRIYDYQLEVSLVHSEAIMEYQQRLSKLVIKTEPFMKNFGTVLTFAHTNLKEDHLFKINVQGGKGNPPYSAN